MLIEALYNNAIVVTPNNRLSNQLLKNFAEKYADNGKASIPKPLCLPYQNFLQYLYRDLQHQNPHVSHPILLNTVQESYIWRQILNESKLNNTNSNFLKHIQEAYNRCRLWQVDFDNPDFRETWQGTVSQDLQKQFREHLNFTNTITQTDLVNYLIEYTVLKNKKIIWACFDDYTPAQMILQNHLEEHGNIIIHYDLENTNAKPTKYQADDINEEYNSMLTWIECRINANDNNIAIVMPNIEEDGSYVADIIRKKFKDENVNISLGHKLTDYLLIAHGLKFIALLDDVRNCDARLILNSPYLAASQSEFIERAELLQNLKILKQYSIKISDLADESAKAAPKLSAILKSIQPYPRQASPSEWVSLFKQRLHDLGFPGEYSLSSEAFQCLNKLQSLFAEFMKFALITPTMQKDEAINALYFLADASIFQPKYAIGRISVLGLLEASGCTFDSIWVTNLTDKCLPGNTNFSAFIPIQMQKTLKMPHSSKDRELKFAKQQLQRLQNSCKSIVFSYSSFIDDIPMLPSPLLINIQEMPKFPKKSLQNLSKLETYTQSYHIPEPDINNIKGGTSLLANQAKCPFMAFAKNRLYALPANSVDDWPNNLERGQILHKILEELWKEVKHKSNLAVLTDKEIGVLINKLSEKIVNENQTKVNTPLHSIIRQGEIMRYNNLIKAAIQWELSRSNFAVEATEKSYTFNLYGVNFTIRIDRLDQCSSEDTSDSAKAIIDYKSRMPSIKPWNEDRPLEPQLLLYALLDDEVQSILYLELRNGHVMAKGISANKTEIPGVEQVTNTDWQKYKEIWHKQLTGLVSEFTEGLCKPNPAKLAICQTCDLQSLCKY